MLALIAYVCDSTVRIFLAVDTLSLRRPFSRSYVLPPNVAVTTGFLSRLCCVALVVGVGL